MSTLLSSAHAAPVSSSASSALGTHSPSAPQDHPASGLPSSPTQSRLQSLFSRSLTQSPPSNRTPSPSSFRHSRFMTEGHLPTHAATLPATLSPVLPTANLAAPTGPSPFASHTYVPPSGAPGFTGDKNWNSAGFEFDESKGTRKSIVLQGRRDPTILVLNSALADSVSIIGLSFICAFIDICSCD